MRNVDPEQHPFGRHRLVQRHEPSNRSTLYVANHIHHLETIGPAGVDGKATFRRVPEPESSNLIEALLDHATQPRYVITVKWLSPGDLVVWDNTCVMHRASPVHNHKFMGKYRRDMRRCTVHDGSTQAWGLNEKSTKRMGLP